MICVKKKGELIVIKTVIKEMRWVPHVSDLPTLTPFILYLFLPKVILPFYEFSGEEFSSQ